MHKLKKEIMCLKIQINILLNQKCQNTLSQKMKIIKLIKETKK